MSQKQTENWKFFLGAAVVLALLGIVSAIIQYTNWNLVIQNFSKYESYRLIGIAITMLIGIGCFEGLKQYYRKQDIKLDSEYGIFLLIILFSAIIATA